MASHYTEWLAAHDCPRPMSNALATFLFAAWVAAQFLAVIFCAGRDHEKEQSPAGPVSPRKNGEPRLRHRSCCIGLTLLLAGLLPCEGRCADRADAPPTEFNDAIVAFASGEDAKAVALLSPLAERDVAIAQLLLSRLYLHSPLIPRDCDSGVKWLSKSGQNGNAEAAYDLGNLFRRGYCVWQSEERALEALLRAAALGHSAAASAIGDLYLGAGELAPDTIVAIEWFKRGAALFEYDASFALGLVFSAGGITTDYREAYIWFDIAACYAFYASDHYEGAVTHRDAVRERLSPVEIAIARAEADRRLTTFVNENRKRIAAARQRAAGIAK